MPATHTAFDIEINHTTSAKLRRTNKGTRNAAKKAATTRICSHEIREQADIYAPPGAVLYGITANDIKKNQKQAMAAMNSDGANTKAARF